MIRTIALLVLAPIYLFADVLLYSPTEINPSELQGNDFISIEKGNNFIADLGFKEQKNLVDEILGAVGDLDLDATLHKENFDLNGDRASVALRAKINLNRAVYTSNFGDIDRNGQPSTPLRSVYTVVDEAKHELRLESEFHVTPVFRIQPLNVHAGIQVKRIYEVNNLEDYRNRRKIETSLAEIGVTAKDNTDTTANYSKKPQRILDSFNKVLTLAEEIFRKGSAYFADEEKTKIFLDNVLDPLRLDAEFFKLTAERIRDSQSIRVGEILVHSVSLRIIPTGLKFKKDVAQVEYYPRAYTIILHSAFKKLPNSEVVAKSILEVRKGRELKARIELMNTGFSPIRWDRHAFNYEMNEFGYKFDLKNAEHVKAFDNVFARRWFTRDIRKVPAAVLDINSIQEPEYVIFKKDRTTPMTNKNNAFRAEFLVASYTSKTFKRLEKVINTTSDGSEIIEFPGLTGNVTKTKMRIGFKGMKEDEQKTRQLKSYVRIDNKEKPKIELAFEYLFSDQYASKQEQANYIAFLKMAVASNDLRQNSEAMRNIHNALEKRLNEKKDRDDAQYLALRLSLSTEMVNSIFSNPENAEHIKFLIGKLFLGDNYTQWSDITNPRPSNPRFPNECKDLIVNDNELVFNPSQKTSCFLLGATAKYIYNKFKEITETKDYEKRLAIVNDFFYKRKYRAYVPLLILQLATIEKVENNVATFRSIDPLLKDGHLGIEVVLDGNGLDFPIHLNYDKTNVLQRVSLPHDFEFVDIEEGYRRLQNKGAYIRASERSLTHPTVYVRITSNVDFSNGYKFVGSIKDFKFARADETIANFTLNNVVAIEEHHRGFTETKAFSYIIAIPNNADLQLQKGKDYVVSLQAVDQSGNFVSEVTETKFTIP